ncbi:tetratricopeptide repeat protein [Breznakiella homolactica]|uniref:SEC-C domain-containing protein n=1 Tax=Breznakiella homolactica TaxID=2798577 RepID=A0A7T8B954_9SPIR|nr:SEC-C domain-containing protein [Breznakiella homolactica]QQO09289.1 SEC-C domain-containing protein [Breznakiella homolactica]
MMRNWIAPFRRGLRQLSRHNPKKALREFEQAMALCPASEKRELARILFFTGICLERLGQESLALKSWLNARRLIKTKRYSRFLFRFINGYGMRRSGDCRQDDYQAFRSIQARRYLERRGIARFASTPEWDMVRALIDDAWQLLCRSGILKTLNISEKLAIFKRAKLDFPYIHPGQGMESYREPLAVNFRTGAAQPKLIEGGDLCPCGSGLSYQQCCGRIQPDSAVEFGPK